jgi:hypothetical protein
MRRRLTQMPRSQARKAPGRPLWRNAGSFSTTTAKTCWARSSTSASWGRCRPRAARISGAYSWVQRFQAVSSPWSWSRCNKVAEVVFMGGLTRSPCG